METTRREFMQKSGAALLGASAVSAIAQPTNAQEAEYDLESAPERSANHPNTQWRSSVTHRWVAICTFSICDFRSPIYAVRVTDREIECCKHDVEFFRC